jgi:SAM-dependent methyltransferase
MGATRVGSVKELVKRFVPPSVYRPILRWSDRARVRAGSLRRVEPVGRAFGFDRGSPVDRYYIESFLSRHTGDVRGRVMEAGGATYTRRFGGDRVMHSDVLHAQPGNAEATLVGDLATGNGIPNGAFDCVILTQVFQFVYDLRPAVETARAALKPGGVLLATLPGISQISRYDMDRWGEFWRFTSLSARRLFGEVFGPANVTVESRGNVLVAVAFLQGLAQEDLRQREMDYNDRDYELIVTVRAVRADGAVAGPTAAGGAA